MNKNILKHFGLAALLALGANAGAATYAVTTQTQLDEANAKATRGDTIEISSPCADGEYVLNSVGVGYAIRATVSGVCLKRINYSTDHDDYIGGPVSLSNLTWRVAKGYYPHFKGVSAVDCTFKGFFNAEDGCTFDNCTFYAPGTDESGIADVDYYMWCYSGDVTFRACHFYGAGKHLHCYNEGNNVTDPTTGKKIPWTVTLDGCDFHSTKSDKPAVNVKELCGSVPLYYNVIISNCTTDENFPAAGAFDATASKYVISPLVQVDIRNQASASEGISITLDGKNVYKDGTIPQSSAVAKIGETEYATINEAFAAVNGQAGDDVIVKILGDVTESLTADYMWTKNVTLMTEVDGGVSVDLGFRGGSAGVWALLENAAGKTLSVGEGVSIAGLAQLFAGYTGAPNTVVNLAGDLTVDQIWAFDGGTVNILPNAKVVAYGYGDGMIKIRYDGAINVTGNGQDEVQFVAGYIDCDYDGNKELNLTNTSMTAGFIANSGTGRFTLNMSNAKLVVSHELPRGINFGSSAVGTINMSADSCIVVDKIANVSAININAAGATEPVKVIDYTGTDAMTLADYGTVNVTGGEAYVEDNDLWVKAKTETKVVVPDESEIKPVDEEGKEISGDDAEKAKEAAKAAVDEIAGNTGAAMTEGTGVEAAVFAPGEEVKQDVVSGLQSAANDVVKDDKGNALSAEEKTEVQQKVAEIATSKDVSSYVKIDVKSPVVKVEDAVATVKTLVYDVQPMAVSKITTTVDTANPKTVTVEAPVDYNDSTKPITFRLPLTDAFTVSAIVTHEGDPDRLCMVQGTAGARYVEVSATHFSLFSVEKSDIVETSASSKTILGIKRIDYTVTQKTDDLAAAVPWLKASDADMPVAQLISTGLSEGDQIQVYDLEKKTYFSWHYDGTSWAADALSNGGTVPSAETYTLKRGTAFWYKAAGATVGTSGTYTQVGYYSEATVTTKVNNVRADASAASFGKPVHNLLASPKYEDFDIKTKLTAAAGCANDDVILIVATGKRLTFNGTVWCESVVQDVPKPFGTGTYKKTVLQEVESAIVPAGTAFWYLSAGGKPEFEW